MPGGGLLSSKLARGTAAASWYQSTDLAGRPRFWSVIGSGLTGIGKRGQDSRAIRAVSQISKETIEKVLAATDIVDLIGSYLPLKKQGSVYKANCPFHHEKTPSFSVNPVRQSFKCFGCQKGGSALGFVMEYENMQFPDAVRRLAARAGIAIEEEAFDPQADQARRSRGRLMDLHREAAAFFHERLLKDPAAQHARDYLKSRGFGREMA